ncbi:alpha-L-fucosidase [Pochonia chlamydosporia 170]|uniref:alpha-L-fucosidase n=1 Tax=Pochonia chlamydosporia 170 TaxID=1380566 RepID=A0A179EXF6_METCM|nr:alpha-L-fucosidase [Pochonia chlamydosporia 170]OAQ57864.1 alpha-L-fucosidase [Pochonia chlamydosporia 170]
MLLFGSVIVATLVTFGLARLPGIDQRATTSAFTPKHRISPKDGSKIALPTAEQLAFQDREVGVLIHFNIETYLDTDGCLEVPWNVPNQTLFNPALINTDQWMDTIRALGGKFATLVAKHSCGFTMWPSKVTFPTSDNHVIPYNYTISESPVHDMDIVKSFVGSAQKYGIGHGFYYSVYKNNLFNVDQLRVKTTPLLPGQVSISNSTYDQVVYNQLTELLTNYGKLTEIWLDSGITSTQRDEIEKLLQAHQPQAVIFDGCKTNDTCVSNSVRWPGNENGVAAEENWSSGLQQGGDPNSPYFCPAECDTTLQTDRRWFFGVDKPLRSLEEMIDVYHKSVGRNCILELDLTPDRRGLIPDNHATRYKELGDFISSCYGKSVASQAHHGTDENGTYTIRFDSPASIDRIVLMEDQTDGQVIRSYQVLAKIVDGLGANDTSAVPWTSLKNGTSIGHKKIDLFPKAYTVTDVMIACTFVDTPKWRSVSVHLCDRLGSSFSKIQAEAYTSSNGTKIQQTSDTEGGDNVGWIHRGNWLGYRGIDFSDGGATQFSARVASGARSGGGTIQVALDSPTSTPICSLSVSNTGGWQSWKTISANVSAITGTHTVYLTFMSDQASDFVNVNWFTFSK